MRIIKISRTKQTDYGTGYTDPYEVIPKNYKFNGMFYESTNTNVIYVVEED